MIEANLELLEFVVCAAWSPDGQRLATGSLDPNVLIWNLAEPSAPSLVCRGHSQTVSQVAFHPSGELLLSSGVDLKSRLWSVSSGEVLQELDAQYGLRFSADGKWLGCALPGRHVARFEILDGIECRTITSDQVNLAVMAMDFSRDDRSLVVVAPDHWRLIDRRSGRTVSQFAERGGTQARFTSRGEFLMVGGTTTSLRRWPVERLVVNMSASESHDENLAALPVGSETRFGPSRLTAENPIASVTDFDLSADGRRMAVVERFDRVLVFDPQNPQDAVELTGQNYVQWAAISPDGRWVATSGTYAEDVRLWDARSGRHVHSLATRKLDAGGMAFSPDGPWFVALLGDHFAVHRVGTWEEVRRIPHESKSRGAAAFSPDGTMLALTEGSQIRLIETRSFQDLVRLPVHRDRNLTTGSIASHCALRFNRNRALLAVGTMQGTIQVWNLPAMRQRLAELDLDWPSPDSRPDISQTHSFKP